MLTEWKEREPTFRQRRRRIIDEHGFVPAYPVTTTAGEHEVDDVPASVRRSASRAAGASPREPGAGRRPPTPNEHDEIAEELGLEHAEDGHELDLEEEAAPVGLAAAQADRSAQLRAERAERKKQRAARQARKRKHGRAR